MSETPRLGHEPIEMRYFADKAAFHDVADPRRGDFHWDIGEDGRRTLVIRMPSTPWGRSERPRDYQWTRWTIDHQNHCGASWSWDGNEVKPTLSPSLHAVGHWHGYVRNGMLVEA
jgi:hypothetical protein